MARRMSRAMGCPAGIFRNRKMMRSAMSDPVVMRLISIMKILCLSRARQSVVCGVRIAVVLHRIEVL